MVDGCETPEETGSRQLKEAGYATASAKGPRTERKRGGSVAGKQGDDRPDRRSRGGGMHGKPKVGAVNIIIGKGGGQPDPAQAQMAARAGMQKGVQMGAQAMAAKMGGGGPRPGMAPPGPGAPPGGGPMPPPGPGPGGPPPQMAKDGGKIRVRGHERRRSGGVV